MKGIDWRALHDMHRPRVTPSTTRAELFQILSDLLAPLEDGHVFLQSSVGDFAYTGWFDRYAENYDAGVIEEHYLMDGRSTPSRNIRYGRVAEGIGYLHLPTFGGTGWAPEIDDVLAALDDVDALIIDVRHNGGGSDLNSERIAARFAVERRVYRRFQFRDGPEHDDFTEIMDDELVPIGPPFGRPVAVLTNRRVFSAAEEFVLAMRTVPDVVFVGDTSGGGSGNPIELELPIGWTYTVSRWIEYTPEGKAYEGVGVGPDVFVQITPEDEAADRDTILERAIEMLGG